MICRTCGGSEIYNDEGVDYCAECHMQFKGSQSEESADDCITKSVLLSSPSVKKTAKVKRKIYQPWISTEAYNLILAKQVSELIKLGCSKKLKDVVFHMWAKYLQNCEIAFRKKWSTEDDAPHLSVFAVKRDVQLLYGDGRAEKKKRKSVKINRRDTLEKNKMKGEKEVDKGDEDASNSSSADEGSQISSEGPSSPESSDDSPATDASTDEEGSSDSSSNMLLIPKKKVYSSAAKKYMEKCNPSELKRKSRSSVVHHMTLPKTLSFCQLGLLYTEDQLLLFDLIRLINEDDVPYIDVTRHFLPSMQLQDTDHLCYTRYTTPELRAISMTSANLMNFLKLPKFKHPSLLPIAIRFVKDLNLPNDLIPALKIVIEDFESKRIQRNCTTEKIKQIPLYEVQAMAAVIVVLKMLLVLDGNFEVEHDEVMTKLNAVVEGYKFFIWNEWKQQAELKEYLFLGNSLNNTKMSRLDSLSTDRIIESYPYCCMKTELNSNMRSKATEREKTARNTLKNVLEKEITVNPVKKIPTSFPLRYELQRFMTDWKRLPIYKDTTDIDFSFISRDFSRDKFCYQHFDGSTNTDDLINVLISSLYEPVELVHIFPKGTYHENILRTSKKYWSLNISHKTLSLANCRTADRKGKWLEELPSTFKWLLMFVSKYLQVSCTDLYIEIKHIEKNLKKLQKLKQ